MKRISIVAVLTLVASVLVGLAGLRPAWASQSTVTTIFVEPASSSYGRSISLSGVVDDNGCISNCQHPQGRIDYWRATSAADFESTKVFLASSGPLGFQSETSGDAAPISYCCLPIGTWLIKGFYVPSTTGWDPSSDEATDLHTVSERPTTMTLTQSSTTSSFGQSVTFTATVTPFEDNGSIGPLDASAARPTGTVAFTEDPDANTHLTYGTVGLNQSTGQASVTISTLAGGTHNIKANYNSDSNYQDSRDSVDHTVTKASSSTSLSASPTTSTYGDTITMTAGVSPSGTTGTVAFQDASDPVFPVTFATRSLGVTPHQAVFTSTSPLDAGSHSFVATYNGDANYASSTSSPVSVTVNKASSSTVLAATTSDSRFGQQVTFTAFVRGPGTLAGSVQFKDGSDDLGSAQPVSGGQASLDISTLPAGRHTITAEYLGDNNHDGSTSLELTSIVEKADTSIDLTQSTDITTLGQGVTFTATLSVVAPGGGTPDGTVQFTDGATNLGVPQPLVGGVATLSLTTLGGGTHTIGAVFGGTSNYNGSSDSVTHTVTCDRVITGTVRSIVASGTTCLSSANIRGSVSVPAGATLSLVNSTVSGGVSSASGAGPITICGTRIGGGVKIIRANRFVLIGDAVNEACAANDIHGSVKLSSNTGGFDVGSNHIWRDVLVTNNVGAGPEKHSSPEIEANTIGGKLSCSGDSPVVTDEERSNSVVGVRSGECGASDF